MSDAVNVLKPWSFTAGLVGYYTATEVDALIAAIPTPNVTSASVDLTPYARLNGPDQVIIAKGLMAGTIAFDIANGLTYMDTGEGYGKRLYFVTDANGTEEKQALVYASDLEPLNQLIPRIEAIESRPEAATREWVSANFSDKDSVYTEAEADSLFAGKTATYTKAESDNLFAAKSFTNTVYTKTQSDAQFAAKATTYTKSEVDAKVPNLADYAKTAAVPAIGSWLGAVPSPGMTGSVASRKIGDDMVQLHGNLSFTAPITSNQWTDVALLQSNARPTKDTNFTAVAMDGTGTPSLVSVWVYATGKVTVRNYGSITSIQFNHIMASR